MKGRDTNNVRAVQHFDAHIIKLEKKERRRKKRKEITKGLFASRTVRTPQIRPR